MNRERADDEMLLHLLVCYRAGMTYRELARLTGERREGIRGRIRRVIDHDCRHDPAACGYWRRDL